MTTEERPMTPDLGAIEARERAATPGPWSAEGDEIRADGALVLAVWAEHAHDYGLTATAEDLTFIAHARVDIPTLTARVRELEAEAAEHLAARSRSARLLDAIFAAGLDPRNPPRVESHEAPETAYARALIERLRTLAPKESP